MNGAMAEVCGKNVLKLNFRGQYVKPRSKRRVSSSEACLNVLQCLGEL